MNCNITTGYVPGASVTPSGTCLVPSPGKVILFSPQTIAGTDRSATFTVLPGTGVLIDAYNMVPDLSIFVNRVVVTAECITTGCACGGLDMKVAAGSTPEIVYRNRMNIGNSASYWTLVSFSDEQKKSRNQLLITLPGTYELELEDAAQQLGDMEVEYQSFKLSDVGHLPDSYYGGIA